MIPPPLDNGATLVLRRVFPASRERVFRAWIEPQALERWLKPGGRHVTVCALDAQVGGSFRFEFEDGNAIVGTYLRVAPPEQLIFTWTGKATQDQETIVTLDFLDRGSATEVVLTHEGLRTPEQRVVVSSGWPSLLDTLAAVLSSPHQDV
jgi:uncharacterized protein YndB with AHSA1/START domain